MSKNTLRAGAGLVLALALAAFSWPTDDGGDVAAVQAAAPSDPVVVGFVDESAIRPAGEVLSELADRIAADVQAAEDARALEAYLAAEQAIALERYVAAIEADKLARYVAALEENAAREAEARAAEERRAAAVASAPSGSLEAVIQRHFGSAAPAAIRIAQCESSMNPNARSATNDHGLFQINAVHRGQFEAVTGAPWSSVYDAELNTIYARHLYGQQGWSPWTCA